MQRSWTRIGLGVAVLAAACVTAPAASTASVAGIVRDGRGTVRPGAMVQVFTAGSAVATAFTDLYGRYRIANLAPGHYQVRATAAMFLPTTRANLRLVTGMRATVNLTMNMLADPAVWLPAERKAPGEPSDDWTWTLRSAPDRPILRMLGDGSVLLAGADGTEEQQRAEAIRIRAMMTGGDAGFGEGGVHNVIALDRVGASGSDVVLQADLGAAQSSPALQPSGEISIGYQRKSAFGNASRMVMTYGSHPEIQNSSSADGMQWLRLASAQKMQLGDIADVEAGGTVYAVHANGYALSTQPFLRVTVHPGQVWAVRYRMATSRNVQGYDALNSLTGDTPVTEIDNRRLTMADGLHQEIAVMRKAGSGTVRVMVYHDDMTHPAISGTGADNAAQISGASVDTVTGNFQLLGGGYSASGVSVAVARPIASDLWGSLEYASGSGLATGASGQNLAATSAALHPVSSGATTAALESGIDCTRTKVRASYRWQPHGVVTPVNAYSGNSDQAYLSFYVRQAISLGNLLPQGLEATVDVTNLLAEGYHPFLSKDGRTLYLAQAPRTVKAGLAFKF